MDHFSYSSLSIWISIIYPCPSACDSAVLPTMVGGGSFRSSTLDSRLDHWRLIYNRIQTEGRQCTAPKSIPCSLWCTMRGGFTIPFQLLPFSFDPARNLIWSPTWASQASPRSAKSQPTHRPMSVKINIGCQASHCNSEVSVTQQNLTDTHGNTNSWTPMSINITGKKKWLAHRQHRCDNNQHSHLLQKTHTCCQFDPDHNPAGQTSGQLQMETQRLRDT